MLAMRKKLRGPYNVVADGAIPWSKVLKTIGVRYAPIVPVRLAKTFVAMQWRYFGGQAHPSWVDALMGDYVVSNAGLKAAGWQPRYTAAEALRSVL